MTTTLMCKELVFQHCSLWALGFRTWDSESSHCLLFCHRLCCPVLLAPPGRWLNPLQACHPRLLLEAATKSTPTRWSARTPGSRSSMPFCSPRARPVSRRPLSRRTAQAPPGPGSKTRKCRNSQPLPAWLPRVRAWRGSQLRGPRQRQRREGPPPTRTTQGRAL